MSRPKENEYPNNYSSYIQLVDSDDIISVLQNQIELVKNFFINISEEESNISYAEGKWSIKEVFGHVIDTERIFAYRALRISKNDKTMLSGFDQDFFVENSNYKNVSLQNLIDEFIYLRKSNVMMFKNFSSEMWNRIGAANEKLISVRAILFILAGHLLHHLKIIEQKYLK